MNAFRGFLLATLIALTLAPTGVGAPPPVELITDTEFLQPSTTLELRFSQPMIARDEVGTVAVEPPVVIAPPMSGRFTWLSQRSGVFAPTEVPALGTEYTVSLRAGLKNAAGKPGSGSWREKLRTPEFGVTTIRGSYDPENVAPDVTVRLGFNLAMELNGAEKFFQFVDAKGSKVPAKVRYVTKGDYFQVAADAGDWEERWRLARDPGANAAEEEEEGDEDEEPSDRETPLPDRFLISPEIALTAGIGWCLEMAPGLPARGGKLRLTIPLIVPLGDVRAFAVRSVTTDNLLNSGRSVRMEFTHGVAPDITSETAAKFFRVEPAVANLRFEEGGSSLVVRGDFQLSTEYYVTVEPAVVSQDGLLLEGERAWKFRFAPVKPRLYLPEITGHQVLKGRRKLEVLGVNLQGLRVIARVVDPAHVAEALKTFEAYHLKETTGDGEEFQAILPEWIPSQVVAEKALPLPVAKTDAKQAAQIDWNEVLGAQAAGAIFVTVEGEPLAEIGGPRIAAQALIQLTDLGVLWKKTDAGLRVSVFSVTTGSQLPRARVTLLGEDFRELAAGTTDAEGNASLAIEKKPAWMVVRNGDDVHALAIGSGGDELPLSAFNVPIDYTGWETAEKKLPPMRGLIFTDRPLYRPGETVHVKGILRESPPEGLTPAAEETGMLKLLDARGNSVSETEIVTDARGAFDATLTLGPDAVGNHTLRMDMPGLGEWQPGSSCRFLVADYQPNAFEVKVALPDRLTPSDPVRATVSGKYLFGAPLTKADLRWTLRHVRQAFAPEGFSSFHFGPSESPQQNALTLRGEGSWPDATTIEPQLPAPEGAPSRGILTVEVTDLNQQTVSETREFTRDASSFYLGIAPLDQLVVRPGEAIAPRVIAVKADGLPLPVPVEVKAELIRLRFETVRVQGAGQAISFRTETVEEPIAEATGKTLLPTQTGTNWATREGETVRFKVALAGGYKLRVTAKDGEGRAVLTEAQFYVSGRDEIAWDYRHPSQVDLVADKAEYMPGDTARLLIKTPISGEALVTIERGAKILRTMRVRLEGNAPTIEVPIEAGDAPNVFVSMVLIRGINQSTHKIKTPEYRYGLCMLPVTRPVSRLQVEITPERAEVQPGQEVEAEIIVRDGKGAVVADAEVTFFAVDDGILALTGYERPQPGLIFGAPYPLAVRTGLTLFSLLPEDPAALEFANKGYLIGGGGLEGPGTKLRDNFPGTACWMPSLRTGADGRVRVKFKAPDALTRYRLVAVAHAGSDFFGSGEAAFQIRKPLMLLPSLGQFANVGDEIAARGVIRNDTGADGTAEITLLLDRTAESTQPTALKLPLKNGEARAFDFPVRFREIGTADWRWSARLEAAGRIYEDHVSSTIAVGSPSLLLREVVLGETREATFDLLAGVNPQLLEGAGTLAVSVANTRLSSLRESVTYLREYPYRCAEQTVSMLIPWVVGAKLAHVFPDLAKAETDKAIHDGVAAIFAMQTGSGGISMWPGGSEPQLFASAYAALVLAMIEKRGVTLPIAWEPLLTYLSDELRGLNKKHTETQLEERVLALFALASAGRAEPAYHAELFRRRTELSRETRALLALAIISAGGPASMIDDLLNPRKSAPEAHSWFGSPARERAIQLMAWSAHQPKSGEVGKLVKELLQYRRNGHWGTTQSNAWALLALTRYFTAVEQGTVPVKGSLVYRDIQVPFHVTREQPARTQTFTFDPTTPPASLAIENPDKGLLFTESRYLVRPPVGNQPRQDRGFAVSRNYSKLAEDGSLTDIADLKVGDRVLVTLRVESPRPGHFIAIDDPVPAVLEPVNPSFESRAVGGAENLARDWVSDYREIRHDRVLIFCDSLPAGAFQFRYLARVRSAGSATAPSTKVEEMYRPERFGLGESLRVVARAAADK